MRLVLILGRRGYVIPSRVKGVGLLFEPLPLTNIALIGDVWLQDCKILVATIHEKRYSPRYTQVSIDKFIELRFLLCTDTTRT
jgi:hypothetical protein